MSFSFGGGASTGSSGFSFGGGAKPPATNAPATGSLGGFGFGGATSTTTAGAAPTFGGFGTAVIELLLLLPQSFSVSICLYTRQQLQPPPVLVLALGLEDSALVGQPNLRQSRLQSLLHWEDLVELLLQRPPWVEDLVELPHPQLRLP